MVYLPCFVGYRWTLKQRDLTSQISFNPSILQTGEWDLDTWDNANWGGGLVTTKIWQGVTGLGYAWLG